VKRKKNSAGSPGTAIRKHQRETVGEDPIALFAKYIGRPDALSSVFAKTGGSGRVKKGCIGNCIPCRKKKGCEIYKKIKACFNGPGKDA
jgi:hypothetical protein